MADFGREECCTDLVVKHARADCGRVAERKLAFRPRIDAEAGRTAVADAGRGDNERVEWPKTGAAEAGRWQVESGTYVDGGGCGACPPNSDPVPVVLLSTDVWLPCKGPTVVTRPTLPGLPLFGGSDSPRVDIFSCRYVARLVLQPPPAIVRRDESGFLMTHSPACLCVVPSRRASVRFEGSNFRAEPDV